MKGYAFFDFDNTIIHGDAGPMFGAWMFRKRRAHVEKKHRRPIAAARKTAMWARVLPFVGWMSVQSGLYKVGAVRRSTVVLNAYRGLKGVPVAPLDSLLEEFAQEHIPAMIYPHIVKEMERHIAEGRECVIITTGMEILVSKCMDFLPEGVQLIGCRLDQKRGRLTGKVVSGPLYGADKANIMLAFCQGSDVDPADCWAYSDHYSDKHMMEAVGHGVCVNPRSRLRSLAKKNGWQVLDLPDPSK